MVFKEAVRNIRHLVGDVVNQNPEHQFIRANLPLGWEIDRGAEERLVGKIKATVIPIKPGKKATKYSPGLVIYHQNIMERFRERACLIVIRDEGSRFSPDAEIIHGYSLEPILYEDLEKDPAKILQEVLRVSKRNDILLRQAKRVAYLALTGVNELHEVALIENLSNQ